MKRLQLKPHVAALVIALLVFGAVTALQRFGFLERWELEVYDIMIRARHDPAAIDPRIVLIGLTEDDIRNNDYPIHDDELAKALEYVFEGNPKGIGLDIYRDLAEPREHGDRRQLTDLFTNKDGLVAIFNLPEKKGSPFKIDPPPEIMKLAPDLAQLALGFNDSYPDDRGVVHRCMLRGDGGKLGTCMSFAFNMALQYMNTRAQIAESTIQLGRATFDKVKAGDAGYCARSTDVSEGFQILLDFKGPEHFTTYPISDVLKERIPVEAFKDKIVLIGTMAPSVKDYLTTPLKGEEYGVVVQAQTINQILRCALEGDSPMRVLNAWWKKLGWPLLWALLGGGAGYALLRWPNWAGLILLAGAVLLALVTWRAFLANFWLASVESAMNYAFAAFGTFGLVHMIERKQRSDLMQIFSRHVSEKVAKNLWDERETFLDGGRLRPQKITATVLFTDFVGFSTVSEKIGDPSALMEWLNDGMQHLAHEVEVHDGVINKYIGDAIMAMFGVPVPRETEAEIAKHAVNAARCALAMGATIEKLNARWREEGRHEIGMRIGIYTGSLVAGTMGASERLEYTVIGDTVNTASRLESTRKDEILPPPGSCCRILIGESTHALLGGKFETQYVGEEHLKGKANTVSVYLVLREIPDSNTISGPPNVVAQNT